MSREIDRPVWVQSTGNGHSGKHHLNPMCPWLELETAHKKPPGVYPELDVCSWCQRRYDNWDGYEDNISTDGCERCANTDADGRYCRSCRDVIDRRQARR